MSQSSPADGARSAEQVARERAMGEVSDVLLNLDHTIARAKKARTLAAKDEAAHNTELALTDLIRDLERSRKRLMQDTYYAGDALRLI